jgi:O-antigen/teichoic acid export membrane protein
MLKNVFDQFRKIKDEGSFTRNVSITSTWNVMGILSQFILSPVITRLYTPAQYGGFALYNTIVINVVLISSLRYSEAIVISESFGKRNNIVSLAFLLALTTTFLSALAVYLFQQPIQQFIGSTWPAQYIYIIPLAVFLGATLEILITVNVGRRKFFSNGLAGFLTHFSSRSSTILYALAIEARVMGLVSGDLAGKAIGITGVLASFRHLRRSLASFSETVSIEGMRMVARLYSHFPLYTLPTNLLILFSGHLPIYFFQLQFTSGVVGSYALSSSLLEMINRLIPYSLAGVFFPKARDLKSVSDEHLMEKLYKLYWAVFILSIGIFSILCLFSKYIFPFVFGESWSTAGIFMGILSLYYSFHFIAVSISDVYKVINKQRFFLIATIISVFLKLLVIVFAVLMKADIAITLFWFCISSALGAIIQILGVFVIFRFRVLKVVLSLSVMMAFFVLLTYFANF